MKSSVMLTVLLTIGILTTIVSGRSGLQLMPGMFGKPCKDTGEIL